MTDQDFKDTMTTTDAAMVGYGVEIQFFDTADHPEARVTLPLAHFLDHSPTGDSSITLGHWLKLSVVK